MRMRRSDVCSIVIASALLFAAGCGSRTGTGPAASESEQKASGQPATAQQAAAEPAAPVGAAERAPAPAASRSAKPARAAAREAAPRAAAAAPAAVLAAGTALKVRTTSAISTKTAKAGDVFEASLAEPVLAGGRQVFGRGAVVKGRVVEADAGGRVKGVASLALALTSVGGVPVSTATVTQQAQSSKKKDAAKVGIGAGIGAAIGAIAGGGKGAGIGAAAGGGAGTAAVLATRGDAAVVPAESVLTFQLVEPATVR